MNERTKLLFTATLLFGVIGLIYYSTSQPYSNQDIRPILNKLPIHWMENTFLNKISFTYGYQVKSIEANGLAGFLEFFIRKGSHLTVFALVGFLATRLLAFFVRLRVAALLTFVTVLLYASIDETRQYFSAERQGLIGDVVIDTVGGLIGILLMVWWLTRKRRVRSS